MPKRPTQRKIRPNILLLTLASFLSIMYLSCRKEKESGFNTVPVASRPVRLVLAPKRQTTPPRPQGPREVPPYVPPEGKVTLISLQKDKEVSELVQIKAQVWGLTSKFGAQYALTDRIGVDWKVFYYKRLGIEPIGILANKNHVDFTVGASYRLDQISFIDNTELKISYSPFTQRMYLGVRINL